MNSFVDTFLRWLTDEAPLEWAVYPPNEGADGAFVVVLCPATNVAFHLVPVPESYGDGALFRQLSEAYQSAGIKLIHLWEDVWRMHTSIVQSRVRALLGRSVRIYARQTTARRLDKLTVDAFLVANHLQAHTACRYKYGLYHHEALVAVATFAGPRRMFRQGREVQSYELLRFASLLNHTVVGGLDKLIRAFERNHHPDDLMTYADRDWSDGHSYSALGFELLEATAPQSFWVDTHTWQRYYPHRLAQAIPVLNKMDEADWERILAKKGMVRVYNAGNLKYLRYFGVPEAPPAQNG